MFCHDYFTISAHSLTIPFGTIFLKNEQLEIKHSQYEQDFLIYDCFGGIFHR